MNAKVEKKIKKNNNGEQKKENKWKKYVSKIKAKKKIKIIKTIRILTTPNV